MVRSLVFAASMVLAVSAFASGEALAKSCRDAKGKFVTCASVTPPPKHCKDSKGKFVKCTAPGAIPVKP